MTMNAEELTATAPRVYQANDSHFFLNWIVEGTDGAFYSVPSEPGGWKHRSPFAGSKDTLTLVSAQKAQAIARFVGGDNQESGAIAIARGNGLHSTEYVLSDAAGSRSAW
jgi:hypothetical protein